MAKLDDSVPPVPVPSKAAKAAPASAVPPVEPKPRTRKPATTAAVPVATPAVAPAVEIAPAATAVSPYAAPATPAQQAYVPVPAGPPQGLAITSMVTGIAGIILGGFVLASIAAVITGHMAQKRQPYARGFWLTGLITGYIGLAIGLIVLLFIIFWILAIVALASSSGTYNF
jgi:hypothetical protein